VIACPAPSDRRFGIEVAPFVDMDGDGLPDIRIRSTGPGADGEPRSATWIYSGMTGTRIGPGLVGESVDALWEPIEGDLDDDGDVDYDDTERLLLNLGDVATEQQPRLADIDASTLVDPDDLVLQLVNYRENEVAAAAAGASGGPCDCSVPNPDGCCTFHVVTGEYVCCQDAEEEEEDCDPSELEPMNPGQLLQCSNECVTEWINWINGQRAAHDPPCDPIEADDIKFVKCKDTPCADPNAPFGM